jgi:hypothetical protein
LCWFFLCWFFFRFVDLFLCWTFFQFLDHIGFCICLGGIYVGFCNADLYFGSFFRCILFRYLSLIAKISIFGSLSAPFYSVATRTTAAEQMIQPQLLRRLTKHIIGNKQSSGGGGSLFAVHLLDGHIATKFMAVMALVLQEGGNDGIAPTPRRCVNGQQSKTYKVLKTTQSTQCSQSTQKFSKVLKVLKSSQKFSKFLKVLQSTN